MSDRPRLVVEDFDAMLFDLDGVITDTARVHSAAWKKLFDGVLRERAARTGAPFVPFDEDEDYRRYVDGKPRYEGVRSFLNARGIELPYGDPSDPPEAATYCGIGNRKNQTFVEQLRAQGVEVFASTVALIQRLRERGRTIGVVSASKNCAAILRRAELEHLFDVRVSGVEAAELGLPGKPQPDTYVHAARLAGASPRRAVVFEDAISGVEAGRAGAFGLVVGIDRHGDGGALAEHGADVVVGDLAELEVV